MPRHVREPVSQSAEIEPLVANLAGELRDPKPIGQPIVLEDRTPETKTTRVHVIWDRWDDFPGEARSAAIQEAYEAAFGREYREQITLALGLTVPEAISVGLLPFEVLFALRYALGPSAEEIRKAMLDAGASTLVDAAGPQLRCAEFEDAQAAQEYLEKTLPDLRWSIVQHVPSAMD